MGKIITSPPDGGWGYACIVGMAICMMLFGLTVRAFGLIYIILLEEFQTTATIASLVGSLNILAWGGFAPFASMICSRYSCRVAAVIGTTLQVTGFILTGLASSVLIVFITFGLLVGIGSSLVSTSCYLMIPQYFNKRRAFATSLGSSGASISILFMPVLLKYIFEQYDFRGAMLLVGGFCLHGLIGAALFKPPPYILCDDTLIIDVEPQQCKTTSQEETQTSLLVKSNNTQSDDLRVTKNRASTGEGRIDETSSINLGYKTYDKLAVTHSKNKCCLKFSFVSTLKNNHIVFALLLVNFGAAFQDSAVAAFTPVLAIENGISKTLAYSLLSWSGISDTIGRCLIGFVMDLDVVRPYNMVVYGMCALVSAVCCVLIPLYAHYAYYATIWVVQAGFTGGIFAQRSTILLHVLTAKEMPIIFGILQCSNSIGIIISRTLGGILRDITGVYDYVYFVNGGVAIVCALTLLASLLKMKT